LMTGSLLTGAGGTYAGMQWLANETPQAEAPNQLIDSKDGKQIEQEKIEKMETAYQLILNSYVEKVEEKQLVEGAIQGMLATLEDPYSVYMDEETAKQFSDTLESSFE